MAKNHQWRDSVTNRQDSGYCCRNSASFAEIWLFVLSRFGLAGRNSAILAKFQPNGRNPTILAWPESGTESPDRIPTNLVGIRSTGFKQKISDSDTDQCQNLACRNPATVAGFRWWSTASFKRWSSASVVWEKWFTLLKCVNNFSKFTKHFLSNENYFKLTIIFRPHQTPENVENILRRNKQNINSKINFRLSNHLFRQMCFI
jgi:hypothetical protein